MLKFAPLGLFSIVIATGVGSVVSQIDFKFLSDIAAIFGSF